MSVASFRWPKSPDGVTRLRYFIAGEGFFSRPHIQEAFRRWQSVASVEFTEAPFNDDTASANYTDIVIAPLAEVKKIIPGYDGAIGLAGVITKSDGSPRRAYVGLQARDGNDQWVAVHEIGHVLGFADDYGSPNTETVYSITPGTGNPQARDIFEAQAIFGASPRDDVIIGGDGSGPISGGDGADILYGNQGLDTLFGGNDADTLYGGQGEDVLYGNRDDDTLYGNLGNDTLYGGRGDDWLHGGQGDDVLIGGLGADTIHGGAGYDVAVYRGNGITKRGNVVTGPGFRHELHGIEAVEINGITHPVQN